MKEIGFTFMFILRFYSPCGNCFFMLLQLLTLWNFENGNSECNHLALSHHSVKSLSLKSPMKMNDSSLIQTDINVYLGK